MKSKTRHIVVALRMAGIAGQDKLSGIFEYLSEGLRWNLAIYRTQNEFTAETVSQAIRCSNVWYSDAARLSISTQICAV